MHWIIYCIVIVIFLVILITIIDMNQLKIKKYHISSNKILQSTRVVFLSDLHNNVFGKNNSRLLDKIEALKPDYVFIGGDMIVANGKSDFLIAEELIRSLTKNYKVFYALGNHEYRVKIYKESYKDAFEKYLKSIQSPNLKVLDNQSILLNREGIKLSGLTLNREYYHRIKKVSAEQILIESNVGTADENVFQILLAHNPVFFEKYDTWGADLTLSGHLHGGILRLPIVGGVISSSFELFPKYDGGEFRGKNGKIIVSRGLGAHTIPIRVFNPCELVCIDFEIENTM